MLAWWIFAIIAAVLIAAMMILEKKVLFKEHAMQYEAVHKLFILILIIFLIPYVDFNLSPKIFGLLVLIGLACSIAAIYMAKAYRHMEISEVAPLKNLSPALVVILAFFILKEKLALIDLGGIALLLVGAYILEADHHLLDLKAPFEKIKKSKYIHYVFMVLIIWAFVAIGVKYILAFVDPVTLVFFMLLFISIPTITAIYIYHGGYKDIKKGIKIYGGIIFLSAVLEIVSALSFFQAVSMAYISLAIPIKRLSSLFATVVGGELFHEKNLLLKSIACVVMIIGAALIII